jgi:hypothetical protein
MSNTFTSEDHSQVIQTIEMFEVITQSQPLDCQSLEILREAYAQMGREEDVIVTSKRIADAYVQLGQLSSALLEYETLLQRVPDDPEMQAALQSLTEQARPSGNSMAGDLAADSAHTQMLRRRALSGGGEEMDDGRKSMIKVFVESNLVTQVDFDTLWVEADYTVDPADVVDPFVQRLADKTLLSVERALKELSDRTRLAFLPLERYETDIELTRSFPAEVCRRWCVLPFDRMSKSVMVATANPFSQLAANELAAYTGKRLVWYLAHPVEISKSLRKAFR